MYLGDGFAGAVMVGLAVLALPVAWGVWWFLASLGEATAGRSTLHANHR